ncbi:MAG: phytanoyl-CoA dioxygenase family protein [Flavobacteriales bacterium]|nr:phytanoyl-CoA dioxygenase family protein [Flavobacteriales bacterium]MCB9204184.1 phytanoyl-CoA dioxygenase family protein [Flavobacteriales bacterium]
MHGLIRDSDLREHMLTDGYVHFPFLSSVDIEWCKELFSLYSDSIPKSGFHVLTEVPDFNVKLDLHQELQAFLRGRLEQHLQDFTEHLYSMQIKFPGDGSMLVPHQDWSITNEKTHRSYTLWIPLSDTFPENGGFHLIPGSHELFGNIRGANVAPPYKECGHLLIEHMKPVKVAAGHAMLFDQGLLHYTPNNTTTEPRISVICTITSADAELFRYFYNKEEETLEAYEFNELFWIKYNDFAVERFQKPNTALKFGSKELLPKVLSEYEVRTRLEEFVQKRD